MKHFQFVVLLPEHTDIYLLEDDGTFPNNPGLPVVHYHHAFQVSGADTADDIERLFRENRWSGAWRNGVYDYHHYHSTAHEVLAAGSGSASLQLGGPSGPVVNFKQGDILLLPAGTAHKCLKADADFECIGAYPEGQQYDMNYGKDEERAPAIANIRKVALPVADPAYNKDGPLVFHWKIGMQPVI